MKNKLLTSLFVLFSLAVYGQSADISGRVVDSTGQPVVGASVVVKGTRNGTVTGNAGTYTLKGVAPENVLEISFVGMKPVAVTVGSRHSIDVTMEESAVVMDEVVTIGYGTLRKSDLTGAVSVVKLDNVSELPTVSALEAMQGKVSGVNIISNTGEPGSGMTFQIRGATSITGINAPLIVLDGQPINTDFGTTTAGVGIDVTAERPATDPMANINPADIESIQILKDASSTAIYGSAGANGVVLITTKSGKQGKDNLSFSARMDIGVIPKKIPVANTAEYYNFIYEAQKWDNVASPRFTSPEDAYDQSLLQPNTNWQNLVYQTAVSQDYQISLTGGDKKTKYMLSGNFTDQNSIVKRGNYLRGGFRANIDHQITDKLDISLRSYSAMASKVQMPQANSQGNISTSIVLSALSFKPENVPYNENGDIDGDLTNNPVLMNQTMQDKTNIRTIFANLKLNYQIINGLKFSASGAANSIYTLRQYYWPRSLWQGKSNNGLGTRADNDNFDYVLNYMLSYNRRCGRNNINAVGGYEWHQWNNQYSSQTSTGSPNDLLGYNGFATFQYPQRMNSGLLVRKLSSFLLRANYSYDNRYVVMFTGRADGSSRLAPGHKWGVFPSGGVAWNVNNEQFFSPAKKLLSTLKLRASYGISGNENIGIGATTSKIGFNDVVLGTNSIIPAYLVGSFGNPYTTWEQTAQANFGLDVGVLKDRFNVSVELYQKNTTNLLLNMKLPGSAGYGAYNTNGGEIRNRGIDIETTWKVLTGKVQFDVSGNVSFLRNAVISMGDAGVIYGRSYCNNGQYMLNQPVHVAMVGSSIGMFYGYKTAGIYQNQSEIDNNTWTNPKTGATNIIDPAARPGDIKWVDTNGDGMISAADRTIIGSPWPDFTYGFNLNLSWKGFALAATFIGSKGNDMINFNNWTMAGLTTKTNANILKSAYDGRWTGEGSSNKYPRPNTDNAFSMRFPDWAVEDASYFRVQNVTLSYTLPSKISQKAKMTRTKVFVTGSNLWTATRYTGYDPAVNTFGDQSLQPGVDFGTLPAPRVISAGLELNF